MLCSCTAAPDPGEQGELTDARLNSVAELQKNLFVCTVRSVETENAVILKYNIDLSEYTVYTVEVTDSLDGCTPAGVVKLYQVGTRKEYPERTSMKKGERYVVDAEPWVYGEKVVFLLSPFREAFPQLDAAGSVNGESVSGIKERYDAAWLATGGTPGAAVKRYTDAFALMTGINSDTAKYDDPARGYAWTPDAAFRKKTADASERLLAGVREIKAGETGETLEAIKTVLSQWI